MVHAAGLVTTLWHSVGASPGPCNISSTQPWPHSRPQHSSARAGPMGKVGEGTTSGG